MKTLNYWRKMKYTINKMAFGNQICEDGHPMTPEEILEKLNEFKEEENFVKYDLPIKYKPGKSEEFSISKNGFKIIHYIGDGEDDFSKYPIETLAEGGESKADEALYLRTMEILKDELMVAGTASRLLG